MQLEPIYNELRGLNLCHSAYDFSERYLGRDKSYLSVLMVTQRPVTVETLSILKMALSDKASVLSHSDHPVIQRIHERLVALTGQVEHEIDKKFRNYLKNNRII
jgi:hypothetical protein